MGIIYAHRGNEMSKISNTGVRNLYQNSNGYFVYKNPMGGHRYGMGKDRDKAVTAARVLNEQLADNTDLAEKVLKKIQAEKD